MPSPTPVRRRLGSLVLATALFALQMAPAVAAEITTDLWVYNYGDTVTVTGVDYAPDETVELVTTDPYGVEVDRGTTQTDLYGGFTYAFVLQSATEGVFDVVATGLSSGLSASTQFDPATESFTFTNPAATVQYSDSITFSGTFVCTVSFGGSSGCTDRNVGNANQLTILIQIDPLGGGFTATTVKSISGIDVDYNNGSPGNSCPQPTSGGSPANVCTIPWSYSWQVGRDAATGSVSPATYNIRAVIGGANTPGTNGYGSGLTVAKEITSTLYNGSASGTAGASLALSASITDLDGGTGAVNGVFSPDTNLAGAGVVSFQLRDSTDAVNVGSAVSAGINSSGATTGSPVLTLPGAGTYKLRTTYAGNGFYSGSTDLDTITVSVANTPPVLTVPASPVVAQATSAAGANVSFVVTANDAEDNPDPTPVCIPASGSLFPIGNTTVNCLVSDSGLLSDSDSFVVHVEDTTDPVVLISTAAGVAGSGWFNVVSSGSSGIQIDADVDDAVGATSLTCTDDAGGGPIAVPGPLNPAGDSFTIGDGVHVIACTASDGGGNSGTDSESFSVDQTAPSISATLDRAPAGTGWFNGATGAPKVQFGCSDATSGVAAPGCPADHQFGEGEDQSFSETIFDNAGNSNSAGVTDVDVDVTAPTLIAFGPTGISEGNSYYFGFVPSGPATCTANYDISGSAGCVVTGPSNGNNVGPNRYTATAADQAGNVGNFHLNYTVLAWTLQGFFQPVDMSGPTNLVYNSVKNGSTVPLKFRIFAGTLEITDVAAVTDVKWQRLTTCSASASIDLVEEIATTGGTVLRYDSSGHQFIDNWKTPSGSATVGRCYQVTMTTDDGSHLDAYFKLK